METLQSGNSPGTRIAAGDSVLEAGKSTALSANITETPAPSEFTEQGDR